MPRTGTLVLCVQNLDFSGANQVVLNIVKGKLHLCNVVVLSPKVGTFAARFVDSGAAIRFGNLTSLLKEIPDVFCVVCNTIMTADTVVEMAKRPHPVIWILHEWWDDELIKENLRIRNLAGSGLTLETIKTALRVASHVVFVCEAQRRLYNPPLDNNSVIYVGVPRPTKIARVYPDIMDLPESKSADVFTVLCLGIVCPRKNQVWAVELFRQFAGDRHDVKLLIVGARFTRDYEVRYVEEVKRAINGDPRIELLNVTDSVEQFYAEADCLLVTSINEVTPMVISEGMSWGLPILSTNIAGIPEMFTDGMEGYLFEPFDDTKAVWAMNQLYNDRGGQGLRRQMGDAGKERFLQTFDLDIMVQQYRDLMLHVAPPTILVDMDGTAVDWDQGFYEHWHDRSPIDRTKSYFIQDCVDPAFYAQAMALMNQKDFFGNLLPMEGAIEALLEMEKMGFKVFICTSPLLTNSFCMQEKAEWVRKWLGERWVGRIIMTEDKTLVRGDLLIDDKPMETINPGGKHTTATWKQIHFFQPYNADVPNVPLLHEWKCWEKVVLPMFGKGVGDYEQQQEAQAKQQAQALVHAHAQAHAQAHAKAQVQAHARSQAEAPAPAPAPAPALAPAPAPAPALTGQSIFPLHFPLTKDLRLTAQYQQECLLGRAVSGDEPMSPEDVAAIAGTGSLFGDSCLDLKQFVGTPSTNNFPFTPVDKKGTDPVHFSPENRFGGEDDYTDNFQQFRKVYRSWREDAVERNGPSSPQR